MLRRFQRDDPFTRLQPVTSAEGVLALQVQREAVRVGDAVRDYILSIVRSTRDDPSIALGASPRASLALLHAGQARALLDGRDLRAARRCQGAGRARPRASARPDRRGPAAWPPPA